MGATSWCKSRRRNQNLKKKISTILNVLNLTQGHDIFFYHKRFRTIVLIFIVISSTFPPICPPAFFRCLSNSGSYSELRTTSFTESTGVSCSDPVSHNRVQVLRIPVLLLACSQDWTQNLQMIVSLEALGTNAYNRYAMCPVEEVRKT